MNIQIQGLDKALAHLERIGRKVDTADIVNTGAGIIEGKAKNLAPVDTGHLRGSISIDKASGSQNATARVHTNVEYAPYQEFGTRNVAAQPFMHPAAQQSKPKITKYAKAKINEALKS